MNSELNALPPDYQMSGDAFAIIVCVIIICVTVLLLSWMNTGR